MMKDVTILTFDEMEEIRHKIDNLIDNAKLGAYGEHDAQIICEILVNDLKEFRERFE